MNSATATAAPAVAPPTAKAELKQTLKIAAPLAMAYIAEMAMNLTDTIMVGRLGATELAAVGLVATLFFSLLLVGMAVISMVGVFAAEALAEGDRARLAETVRQGFWAVAIMSIPALLAAAFIGPALQLLGQDPAVIPHAVDYMTTLAWTFPGYLAFTVLRNFLTALGKGAPIMIVTIAAIALNALINYAFIFGNLGMPRLGVAGAGLATSLVSWIMFVAIALYCWRSAACRPYALFAGSFRFDGKRVGQIFRFGLPVGGTSLAESGMFTGVAVMMGLMGSVALAAHNIATAIASFLFMVPMAISHAAATRVAYNRGLGDNAAARRAGWVAILSVVVYMVGAGILIWLAPGLFASAFLDPLATENRAALDLAVELLIIAALFQIVDGVQVVASGALRGLRDTHMPFIISVAGYWGAGFGAAALLAFSFGWGPTGLWWGLALGLTATASMLTWRFHRASRLERQAP